MRRAEVLMHNVPAGILEALDHHAGFRFIYDEKYHAEPVSLTMPIRAEAYEFKQFPPLFDGLLPEGEMLDGLLRQHKIDSRDYFAQLLVVGGDLVGAITVKPLAAEQHNE